MIVKEKFIKQFNMIGFESGQNIRDLIFNTKKQIILILEPLRSHDVNDLNNWLKKHSATEFIILKSSKLDPWQLPNVTVHEFPFCLYEMILSLGYASENLKNIDIHTNKNKFFTILCGEGCSQDTDRSHLIDVLGFYNLLENSYYTKVKECKSDLYKHDFFGLSEMFKKYLQRFTIQEYNFIHEHNSSRYKHYENYKNIEPMFSNSRYYVASENFTFTSIDNISEKSLWGHVFGVPSLPTVPEIVYNQIEKLGFKTLPMFEPMDFNPLTYTDKNIVDNVLQIVQRIALLNQMSNDQWYEYIKINEDNLIHNKNNFNNASNIIQQQLDQVLLELR